MGWDEPLSNVIDVGLEQYLAFAKTQTHAKGAQLQDKHVVTRAIESALEAILLDPQVTVTPAQVRDWVLDKYGFGIRLWRIDEHCKYKTGVLDFYPLKNPTLRVVQLGVYALAEGQNNYTYEIKVHKNK